MNNRELAQALRSAASALEHGRRKTAREKVSLVAHALTLTDGDYDLADGKIWIGTQACSIRIRPTGAHGEYVAVDIYTQGDEMSEPIASCTSEPTPNYGKALQSVRDQYVHDCQLPDSDS